MNGDPFYLLIRAQGLSVPPAVLAFHAGLDEKTWTGTATITSARNPFARAIARLAGFPPAGVNVPTRINTFTDKDQSRWCRDFGGHITRSTLRYDRHKMQIVEKIGVVTLVMSLQVTADRLQVAIDRMRVFGLPVPSGLCPVSQTAEFQDDTGRFAFDVAAQAPLFGQLIRYQGSLSPA